MQLPDQYGYVLLISVLIGFELLAIGFIIPMRTRRNIFTAEFMKENFNKQHMEAFNEEIRDYGYPDSGNGRYSHKLTYKQWYQFSSAQRAHYNFLQWIATTLIFILAAGVYFPITAASLGLAVFIGRMLYAIGYATGGPGGRFLGVIINDFAILGSFVMAIISSIFYIAGKDK